MPKQIRILFAAPDINSSIIARFRPLLPGALARTTAVQLDPIFHYIRSQLAEAWSVAIAAHAGPTGRSSCANPACTVTAADAQPMRVCSRCRWLVACSPTCLRSVGGGARALTFRSAAWPAHKVGCSILAMHPSRDEGGDRRGESVDGRAAARAESA